jgi:hypothetical protein
MEWINVGIREQTRSSFGRNWQALSHMAGNANARSRSPSSTAFQGCPFHQRILAPSSLPLCGSDGAAPRPQWPVSNRAYSVCDLGFLHECVDEPDYNDGAQNDHPIGNLDARYRCFRLNHSMSFLPDRKWRLRHHSPLPASGSTLGKLNFTGGLGPSFQPIRGLP